MKKNLFLVVLVVLVVFSFTGCKDSRHVEGVVQSVDYGFNLKYGEVTIFSIVDKKGTIHYFGFPEHIIIPIGCDVKVDYSDAGIMRIHDKVRHFEKDGATIYDYSDVEYKKVIRLEIRISPETIAE